MLRKIDVSKLLAFGIFFLLICFDASAQDNSPYSRYGLGNQVPTTNIANRGMGGIAAGYTDVYTINYANPASYSFFQTIPELNSKKINAGRVILNIGADAQGRTLIDKEATSKFTSTNILFSHVMVGVPIRKNWGLAFGLRPLTDINYKIQNLSTARDPNTGQIIDSSATLYQGQGGTYLGSIGTAVKFKTGKYQYLSIGVNAGYMFGSKDYSTRLSFINDSTYYSAANYEDKVSIHGIYFDAGLQYHFRAGEKIGIALGAYGNWQQKINTSRNHVAETFTYNSDLGYAPVDTAISTSNPKGEINYPSSITGGIMIQKIGGIENEAGWLFGVDFTRNNWNQFREEGLADDDIKSNWQAKIGAEFHPAYKKSYLSRTMYRVGFYTGPDYIYAQQTKLPVMGVTAGIGLPINSYNPQARYQQSLINVSLEYIKRGNNDNLVRENLYRLSIGFSLTDLWFIGKAKYSDD